MEILQILKYFAQFLMFFLKERQAAKARQEKYELDETNMLHLSCLTIQSMREKAPLESALAKKGEDWLEDQISGESFAELGEQSTRSEQVSNAHDDLRKSAHAQQSNSSQARLNTKRNNNQN